MDSEQTAKNNNIAISDQSNTEIDKGEEEKSKMSKKQVVGLVILSLVALGGVLFGVYGMNSQNEQVAQLKAQTEDAQEKIAKLETEKVTITDPNGGTAEIKSENAINTADYIYVGAWGVKIKIPDNLKNVTYIYNNYGNLCVNGVKYDGQQYAPEFSLIDNNYLACVSRVLDEGTNTYSYEVQGPQAVYSTDQDEQDWEAQTVQVIKEMLTNTDNFSNI